MKDGLSGVILGVVLAAGASALTLSCGDEGGRNDYPFATGALMKPGDNCRSCHGAASSPYPQAPAWSVAGTVYDGPDSDQGAQGVTVRVFDSAGRTVELETNGVGNFYTAETLEVPLHVELEHDGVTIAMPVPPPSGGCNACHSQPTIGGAPGRLYVPATGEYDSTGTCADEVTATYPAGSVDQQYSCAPSLCETIDSVARCARSCETNSDCAPGVTCDAGRCR